MARTKEISNETRKELTLDEKRYPDHFNQPEIKQMDRPNEFIKVEDSNGQPEIKEVATEFRPMSTNEKMKKIKDKEDIETKKIYKEMGIDFEKIKEGGKAAARLDNLPNEEISKEELYGPSKDEKTEKKKFVPDNNLKLNFK